MKKIFSIILFIYLSNYSIAQKVDIENIFKNPPQSAKPWVFWYWLHGAVSKEGITADLEAMKEVGIGGAYLMSIRDTSSAIPFQPQIRTLTPGWWAMVKFAMQEAKRLGLQIGMNACDGFELAGGPWITPELSMQKLTWSKTFVKGGQSEMIQLAEPDKKEGYYKDIAVFAYPANCSKAFEEMVLIPAVTTSNASRASFLSFENEKEETFRCDSSCWIQYKYPRPFTCRSVRVRTAGNNYQALRLIMQASNDGVNFRTVVQFDPPRHGWQDGDEDITFSVPEITAPFFRFSYDVNGSEPGAEDLDAAKWKPVLKVQGIYMSDEPVIHQYESKNGSVWRISKGTATEQIPGHLIVPRKNIIPLTGRMDKDGNLNWQPPSAGNWIVVRIGHTSNGHTNYTGGAGLGLESDKFSKEATTLQFNNWYAKAFEKTDSFLAKEVLKVLHIDSWEAGSQNWSKNFPSEFKRRRGYDLMPWLLVMTGVPVQDITTSEKVLHDVRKTIAELVNDVFYKTLNELAHKKGSHFSSECVAPTMMSDGMLHFKNVDLPMGEFWLNSPTHDKPNDMLDAISGAHIYGKKIIMAEAFTSVRMNWAEHPGNLKVIGDRNFALGINKLVMHVFMHNPWMDKKPGISLNDVGIFFQRNNTWFRQSKVWVDYLTRCQALLQLGEPITDIAVFTGEQLPNRALLPDKLIHVLPGIFGKKKTETERKRIENAGQPLQEIPDGVTNSANTYKPEAWIDPLNGYAYDSFNPDVLMQMKVKNGRVITSGGASYKILVFPDKHRMNPDGSLISLPVVKKIAQLVKDGATVIVGKNIQNEVGLKGKKDKVKETLKELMKPGNKKGKVVLAPYTDASFARLGLEKDVEIIDAANAIAWTHRKTATEDIYFISNQQQRDITFYAKFNLQQGYPAIWDAVTGKKAEAFSWKKVNGKIEVVHNLMAGQSFFLVFTNTPQTNVTAVEKWEGVTEQRNLNKWQLVFNRNGNSPDSITNLNYLKSWTSYADTAIKFYSGTIIYKTNVSIAPNKLEKNMWLEIDSVFNIATVKINGIEAGTLWTRPYKLNISKIVKAGNNQIEIAVTNTWHNRLIGDQLLPSEERINWTNAPFRLKDKPLLPAGLIGKVSIISR